MRRVIGLTGSIGSGKSLVAQLLKEKGAIIIDADNVSREIMSSGNPAFQKVAEIWPETVIDEPALKEKVLEVTESKNRDSKDIQPKEIPSNRKLLDRKALGDIVFNDKKQLELLESIVHPLIRKSVEEQIGAIPSDSDLIFYMAPLIFEASDIPSWINPIVLVSAPKEILIERVMSRDNCTQSSVELRLQYQLSEEAKRRRANYVIDNSSTIDSLKIQVNQLWDILKRDLKAKNDYST